MANEIGALRVSLSADAASFVADLGKASRSLGNVGREIRKAGREGGILGGVLGGATAAGLNAMSGAARGAVEILGRLAAAGVDAAKEIVRVGAPFEASLVQIGTLSEEAAGSLSAFRDGAMQIAIQTGRPLSQVTRAFFDLHSAGDSVEQALLNAHAAARAATAGNADLAKVTEGGIRVLQAYGREATNMAEIQDKMFRAMQGGVLTLEDMSAALPQVVTEAAAAGLSLDELFGSLAEASKVKGASEAFTALRSTLLAIIAPSEEQAKRAREMGEAAGVVGFELSKARIQSGGFVGFLRDLQAVTGGATDRLTQLGFTKESVAVALSLLSNDSRGVTEQIARMGDSAGVVDKQFAKVHATAQNALERMTATVDVLKAKLFAELFDPWIQKVADTEVGMAALDAAVTATASAARLLMDDLVAGAATFFETVHRGFGHVLRLRSMANELQAAFEWGTGHKEEAARLDAVRAKIDESADSMDIAANRARDLGEAFRKGLGVDREKEIERLLGALAELQAQLQGMGPEAQAYLRKVSGMPFGVAQIPEAPGPAPGPADGSVAPSHVSEVPPEVRMRRRESDEAHRNALLKERQDAVQQAIDLDKGEWTARLELQTVGQTDRAALVRLGTLQDLDSLRARMDAIAEAEGLTQEQWTRIAAEGMAARARIIARGAEDAAIAGGSFLAGFEAGVKRLQTDLPSLGEDGAQVALDLRDAWADTLKSIADGSASVADAFVDFAARIQSALLDIAAQKVATASIAGIGSLIPGFASGGSFEVGGPGGIDSELVAFRATPGEHVSISPPGASGADDQPLTVNVTVKNPPAVLVADEWAARTTRAGASALVAKAVSKGTKRGGRAPE